MFDAALALSQLTQAPNPTNRLKVMIGGKDFIKSDEENYVAFKFSDRKFNYCRLTLNNSDLYTLTIRKYTWSRCKMKKEVVVEGLFFDQLKEQFESITGLYLSL